MQIPGPSGGFSVSPPALHRAQHAAASARVLSQVQPKLTGATPSAIYDNPGWESSSALQACLTAWENRLRQLSAQVQQISQKLSTTVENYEAADKQVAGYIQNSLAGLAQPSRPPRSLPPLDHATAGTAAAAGSGRR